MSKNGTTEIIIDTSNIKLKNRDIVDFERVTGMAFGEAFQDGKRPTWTASQALGWVLARQQDPSITWEEVLEQDIDDEDSPIMQLGKLNGANPTQPAPKQAGNRKRS